MTNGVVLYEGRSRITREPIVVVATGLDGSSTNDKTGPMVQTYFMPRDVSPVVAVRTGYDEAVCGSCALRPYLGGSCYVTSAWGPQAVWRAYHEGRYGRVWPSSLDYPVRGGTWGDPLSAPTPVWLGFLRRAPGWTGYTERWDRPDFLARDRLMASVHSLREAQRAWARGWRTFRDIPVGEEPGPCELECRAQQSGGRVTCAECQLCTGRSGRGHRAAHIWIRRHGTRRLRLGGELPLFDRLPLDAGRERR